VKKKFINILILLTVLFTPFYITFAQTSAGFIPGNIWYSKDPFVEGDNIKIYTLIYNPDARQFSGTVFFFDKTTFLGSKDFSVEGKGLKDVSVDWKVTAGDHLIFGQIQNAKFLESNGISEKVTLVEIKTSESNRNVPKTLTADTSNTSQGASTDSNSNVISNAGNLISQNTPSIVSDTISNISKVATSTISGVENIRNNIGTTTEKQKEKISAEIKNLNSDKISATTKTKKTDSIKTTTPSDTKTEQSTIEKPFKYTQLFALSLFSVIFNNKYIFYGLIVLIIFLLARFLVRKFF